MKLPKNHSEALRRAAEICEKAISNDAASYAASAAARYAANAAANDAASDNELATIAEDVVQILVAMDAPGCQWLDMAPLAD